MAPAADLRDTDADWRLIGETEPHWGVVTDPRFKRDALDDDALDYFYTSGRTDIQAFLDAILRALGRAPQGPALDFGCGVGRLTEAMAEIVSPVTGYDIAPGMLAQAQARARSGRPTYVDALPAGPFAWINSYIVFQHIPPSRGFPLMADLLRRLAPGGVVSLHVTCDHADRASAPALDPRVEPAAAGSAPSAAPIVSMYDYDLTMVARHFLDAEVGRLTLEPVNHGGHLGYMFIGARPA